MIVYEQWTSVRDCWPRPYLDVLVTDGVKVKIGYRTRHNEWGPSAAAKARITHWRLLPALPSGRYPHEQWRGLYTAPPSSYWASPGLLRDRFPLLEQYARAIAETK